MNIWSLNWILKFCDPLKLPIEINHIKKIQNSQKVSILTANMFINWWKSCRNFPFTQNPFQFIPKDIKSKKFILILNWKSLLWRKFPLQNVHSLNFSFKFHFSSRASFYTPYFRSLNIHCMTRWNGKACALRLHSILFILLIFNII